MEFRGTSLACNLLVYIQSLIREATMVEAAYRTLHSLRAVWWVPVLITVHDCIASINWVEGWDTAGGKVVLVERLSPRLYRFQRGDVVLLRSPEMPRAVLARRLIGVEGDWVTRAGETKVEKIPKGRCWVEGASPTAPPTGGDSRSFGAAPLALIQGRVTRVLWPPSCWGPVERHQPPGRVIAMGSFSAGALDEDEW